MNGDYKNDTSKKCNLPDNFTVAKSGKYNNHSFEVGEEYSWEVDQHGQCSNDQGIYTRKGETRSGMGVCLSFEQIQSMIKNNGHK